MNASTIQTLNAVVAAKSGAGMSHVGNLDGAAVVTLWFTNDADANALAVAIRGLPGVEMVREFAEGLKGDRVRMVIFTTIARAELA